MTNYFERDALALVKAAHEDPEVVFRIIVMALLSIRQPWYKIPEQFRAVMRKGRYSEALFGFKKYGYDAAGVLMDELHGAVKNYNGNLDELIVKFMQVPGLGLAKASFVAQMTVGDGACLDGHNLRLLGLDTSFTRLDKNKPTPVLCEKVERYNERWKEVGDSAYWWNQWCEGVANRGTRFRDAGEVSAIHRLPLL